MNISQKDAALERLLAYAATLGGERASVTAQRFLIVVIDLLAGQVPLEEACDREALARVLSSCPLEPAELRNRLIPMLGKGNETYLDTMYMQKILYTAGVVAQKNQQPVTPVVVLECILTEPSDRLSAIFTAPSAGTVVGSISDQSGVAAVQPQTEASPAVGGGITDSSSAAGTPEGQPAQPQSGTPNPKNTKEAVGKLVDRVKAIRDELCGKIFGQGNAIDTFVTGYFQAELLSMTDKTRVRPLATYLFAGPPGVGKTFLAESAAKALGNLPFMRFDMSEFSDPEGVVSFCGAEAVYKDAKPGNVTGFVKDHPRCVLLFDEIEKAHISVIHLFLQLLDAGRLQDKNLKKEISFKDAILIFTTNAGRQLYEGTDVTDFSDVSRKVILGALQKDVKPETGIPYFPAAICSRFASGNVVMFNHMTANNLISIARKEILRHADNLRNETGIEVEVDETVYSALLFAEGGAADARTVRSRAETFFDSEIYELFRLIGSEQIATLEKVVIRVDLPEGDPKLIPFFRGEQKPEILLFGGADTAARCAGWTDACTVLQADTCEAAAKLLKEHEISFVLLDLFYGVSGDKTARLNIEDVDSAARDFFKLVRAQYKEIPVYILTEQGKQLTEEEAQSYRKQGVRGAVSVADGESFATAVSELCTCLHQQQGMVDLAKTNRIITHETAQNLQPDGKTAEIHLFDFNLSVAVDSEDASNILSNISRPNIRFSEVLGAADAKRELQYFVEYLKNPKKFMGTGVKPPKGVLLYGPPGTGKTMLAKAMATESEVTFISAEGNQFLSKYVGEGAERVHELFRTARKYAPSILFIDEIDAIARERKGGDESGVDATLTAFLTEMDGFKNDSTKPVFVLAATNFDVQPGTPKSLDQALMRRFDRRVFIDVPTREDRCKYLRMKIERYPIIRLSDEKFENIAVRSIGMSLASLESIVELSLRMAIRDGNGLVTDEIFDEAFETFTNGERKTWDADQLERVARHEAGHAFVYWYYGETPSYLTVVARGNHGGYMQHGDTEGKGIRTKADMLARIRTSLAGRAAEMVYYGPEDGVSSGASGDLQSATQTARMMVCDLGMDDSIGLGVIDLHSLQGDAFDTVWGAINRILTEEMGKTIRIIEENRAAMDKLVSVLLEKNQMTGEEIDALLTAACGGRP